MKNNLITSALREKLDRISEKCIQCNLCVKKCAFLRKFGKPDHIADTYDPNLTSHQSMPWECSLCGLCEAVCPVNIYPGDMFMEMRRETMRNKRVSFHKHKKTLNYEKKGHFQTIHMVWSARKL